MTRGLKVSIIIPCYNREKFIREAIDSALSQHYENAEVIVVNDGSTDNSWDIIESYGNKLNAISIDNRGVSAARNVGISAARGEYVTFLDSDDRLEASCLTCLTRGLSGVNTIMVGRSRTIDSLGFPTGLNTYELSEFP